MNKSQKEEPSLYLQIFERSTFPTPNPAKRRGFHSTDYLACFSFSFIFTVWSAGTVKKIHLMTSSFFFLVNQNMGLVLGNEKLITWSGGASSRRMPTGSSLFMTAVHESQFVLSSPESCFNSHQVEGWINNYH